MFSFRESYFRLVGLFDWGYPRTQFLLLVSRNRYGFTLAGYRNEKYATDPALLLSKSVVTQNYRTYSIFFKYAFNLLIPKQLPCDFLSEYHLLGTTFVSFSSVTSTLKLKTHS